MGLMHQLGGLLQLYVNVKNIVRQLSMLAVLFVLIGGAGCATEPTGTSKNSNSIANTNAKRAEPATPAPAPATVTAPANLQPVTLPILDAFFAQENFASELKSKLQLTDDQVNKLKSIARQETAKLREGNEQDQSTGKATAARERAYTETKAAIGEEKTQQLVAFINERWSGDGTAATPPSGASPAGPNAIPSDRRVVVNSPAFRMDVFEDGKLIKSYKIGIGYPEFPLPSGLRKADTIIFNPTWTPPDEPWVESPNSKVKVGEKVAAGDKLNPLGPIKIPIGLPSLIHGGKAPSKLGTFASHGCVGLTSPQVQDFAKRLAQLSGTEISEQQIAEYQKNKTETKPVKLSKPVPVELRYETITVEDGKLHIYRDVYERGTNTDENLNKVLQTYGVTLDQLSPDIRAQVTQGLKLMARDAGGKPVSEGADSPSSPKGKGSSASGAVTRTIKGGKEVVIEIPALAGKGYPAPVDLDAGVAAKKPAPSPRRRK